MAHINCSVHLINLHLKYLRQEEEMRRRGANVEPGVPRIDIPDINICWGHRAAELANNPHPELARIVGQALDEVVGDLCMEANQRPFTYCQIHSAIDFFLEAQPIPVHHPIARIVATVDKLSRHLVPSENTVAAQTQLIRCLMRLVFMQHLFDPQEYVSHDFRHSLVVATHCVNLWQGLQQIAAVNVKSRIYFRVTVQEPDTLLEGCIELAAYLHDCGYPYLYQRRKATHACYSADQADRIQDSLRTLLGRVVNFDTLYKDLRAAIFLHNADKCEDIFSLKLDTSSGTFLLRHGDREMVETVFSREEPGLRPQRALTGANNPGAFSGRMLDLFHPKDGKLGVEQEYACLAENPFHVLRLADNLDITQARLALNHPDYLAQAVQLDGQICDLIQALNALPDPPDLLLDLLKQAYDCQHSAGCQALESLEIRYHANDKTWPWELIIQETSEISDRMRECCARDDEERGYAIIRLLPRQLPISVELPVPVPEYQIYRAWQAFTQVCTTRNEVPFSQQIRLVLENRPNGLQWT